MTLRLEILSGNEIDRIHEATLSVLEETGVKVLDPDAFEVLRDAGSEADLKTSVVKIPEHVLKEGIKKAPSSFTLFGREKDYKLKFEPGRTYLSSQGSSTFVLDLETGTRRRSTLKDLKSFYILVDALENIHHASWVVSANDLPEDTGPARELLEAFRNTTKTIDGDTYGEKNARDSIEMASIIAGGENELRKYPRLLGFVNPVSPLEHSKLMTEGLRVFAEYEQPTLIAPEAQGGATAPVTLAGILVQQNVEVLSGILISQLTHPGAPVLYGTVSTIADMKTGNVALGAVETGLINIAAAQLAKYYGLPTRGTGGATNAKVPDIQAGYEKALTLSMAAMAGINFIYDAAGMLEASRTASFEQIVLDNELCGMVLRSIHGIDVNEETMATEVIKKVGPGGHFLSQKHTLDHFAMEHYLPTILDRSTWETWQKNGSKELRATARETARKILREHKAQPLDKTVDRELEALAKKIDSERSQEIPKRDSA
jgi:trimethylamine--corrinoid protein Co-methyltransferase